MCCINIKSNFIRKKKEKEKGDEKGDWERGKRGRGREKNIKIETENIKMNIMFIRNIRIHTKKVIVYKAYNKNLNTSVNVLEKMHQVQPLMLHYSI